jgi:hypothetical protein
VALPLLASLDDPHELCGRLLELTTVRPANDRRIDDR